jgi:hypothetical protein
VYAAIVYADGRRPSALLWSGLAFGFAVLTRTTVLVLLPLWWGYLWWPEPAQAGTRTPAGRVRACIAFTAPVAALTLVQVAYQAWAFGSPAGGGYAGEGWTTPLLVGLNGLLLSPGKSLLLFVPLALLAPWGWVRWAVDGRKREAVWFAAISLGWLLVHAKWWTWHGGWSWGPRFLLVIMPFLIVPLGALWTRARRGVRRLILALAVLGLVVELGGVVINFGDYMMLINDEDKVLFNAAFSPVWGHWRMLLGGVAPDLAWLRFPPVARGVWVVLSVALATVGVWGAWRRSDDGI